MYRLFKTLVTCDRTTLLRSRISQSVLVSLSHCYTVAIHEPLIVVFTHCRALPRYVQRRGKIMLLPQQ